MTYSVRDSCKSFTLQGEKRRAWKGCSRLCAHLARRSIWSRLLISNTSCGLICAYASWQVSKNHCARGLPTLLQCSIRGLRVPGSNKTSLMGSSCEALKMWPNNLVPSGWQLRMWVFEAMLQGFNDFLVCPFPIDKGGGYTEDFS